MLWTPGLNLAGSHCSSLVAHPTAGVVMVEDLLERALPILCTSTSRPTWTEEKSGYSSGAVSTDSASSKIFMLNLYDIAPTCSIL